jgi:hypothetical protein
VKDDLNEVQLKQKRRHRGPHDQHEEFKSTDCDPAGAETDQSLVRRLELFRLLGIV